MIEICLLSFGALLLLGSIGAFFLYIPFLHIAVVVVMILGMTLAFLIGVWVGSTRVRRLRREKRVSSQMLHGGPTSACIPAESGPTQSLRGAPAAFCEPREEEVFRTSSNVSIS